MGKYFLLDSKDREAINGLKTELEGVLSSNELTKAKGERFINHLLPYTAAIDGWHSFRYAFRIHLMRHAIPDGEAVGESVGDFFTEKEGNWPPLPKEDWRFFCLLPTSPFDLEPRTLDNQGKAHKLLMEAVGESADLGAAKVSKAAIAAIKKELGLAPLFCFLGARDFAILDTLKGFVSFCRQELPRFREWEQKWEDYRRLKAGLQAGLLAPPPKVKQAPKADFEAFHLCVESATDKIWHFDPMESGQLVFDFNTQGLTAAFVSVDYSKLAELNPKVKRLNAKEKGIYNTIVTIWASQQEAGKKTLKAFFDGEARTSFYQILEVMGLAHTKKNRDELQASIERMGLIALWARGEGWTDERTGEEHPPVKKNGVLLEIAMEETENGRILIKHAPLVYEFALEFHNLVRHYPKEVMIAFDSAGNRTLRQWDIYFFLVESILDMMKKKNPRNSSIQISTLIKAIYGGRDISPGTQTQVIKATTDILTAWTNFNGKGIPGWITGFKIEGRGGEARWTIYLPREERELEAKQAVNLLPTINN